MRLKKFFDSFGQFHKYNDHAQYTIITVYLRQKIIPIKV